VQVDGQIVTELGARVDRSRQEVRLDGEPLPKPKLIYVAVNKPVGVVSTARDPAGRPRVTDLVPPSLGRLFAVGRLDLESEGLILLTNDGALADRLTHPRHGVHKVYEVQVAGFPEPEIIAQLKRGVHLSEGYAHAVDVKVRGRRKRSTVLEMVLDEGRNREVRRLLARVGHKVQRLTRIAVGPIRLGEMPRGAYRRLTADEVKRLHDPQKLAPPPPAPRSTAGRSTSPASKKPATGLPRGKSKPPVAPRRKPQTGPRTQQTLAEGASRRIIGDEGPTAGEFPPKSGGPAKKRPARPAAKKGGKPLRTKLRAKPGAAGGSSPRGKRPRRPKRPPAS
jgi:23S rRNA pseudouridine2605 synthase